MLNKEIEDKILKETNLESALKILEPYKNEKWSNKIIKHLQSITPNDEIPIGDFSYIRKDNI